eukprot:2769794-Amphidinium_carterae.1
MPLDTEPLQPHMMQVKAMTNGLLIQACKIDCKTTCSKLAKADKQDIKTPRQRNMMHCRLVPYAITCKERLEM